MTVYPGYNDVSAGPRLYDRRLFVGTLPNYESILKMQTLWWNLKICGLYGGVLVKHMSYGLNELTNRCAIKILESKFDRNNMVQIQVINHINTKWYVLKFLCFEKLSHSICVTYNKQISIMIIPIDQGSILVYKVQHQSNNYR